MDTKPLHPCLKAMYPAHLPERPTAIDLAVAEAVPNLTGKRKSPKLRAEIEGLGVRIYREVGQRIPGGMGPVKKGLRDKMQKSYADLAVKVAWWTARPECGKCGGTGFVSCYGHVDGGRCFQCRR